ncbi:hypothetical protein BN1723_001973 [Verticillium longisporum]|uniref:Lon N-terminal domain-containing protein n=1 Tax=Verticillium longisporum TaxID=100787 RepID=A0A0G4KVD0_VERLO|nr:hypothetical protein BN1723_001973 [Verticillium longisporum]
MSEDGPPLLRPIPRRPFDINFTSPTPPSDGVSSSPSPAPGQNFETSRLLSPKPNGFRAATPSESGTSISRTQSIVNLTTSTLFGIYSPSSTGKDRSIRPDLETPWGTGSQTPVKRQSLDDTTFELLKERFHPQALRRRSSRPAPPAPYTAASALYVTARVAVLFLLGMGYGALVTRLHGKHQLAALPAEGTSGPGFNWKYLTLWGICGVLLGALLPWFDGVWEEAGGKLVATYTLAEQGELKYAAEVSFAEVSLTGDEAALVDEAVFMQVKASVRTEMDCQVCYALFYDPLTTVCGHTFCHDAPFVEYGTLLRIVNAEYFPDGRSLIETIGISRFKVVRHGVLDGYIVGKIGRIDDVSIAEEEELEAQEIRHSSLQRVASNTSQRSGSGTPPRVTTTTEDLARMPTRDLLDFAVSFVQRMSQQSVPWLAQRILTIYGECPVDAAQFPWWFASILPAKEPEKYRLLGTQSVRERLKICCAWVLEWEANRWGHFIDGRPGLSQSVASSEAGGD